MRKCDIKEVIKKAINPRMMCRLFMKYDSNCLYGFPIRASENLFLCANEDDFILDGYSIRRFKDVVKAEVIDNTYNDIVIKEGIIDNINDYDINLCDWYNVFISLQKMNKNIIVEKEDYNNEECFFAIGKISRVTKTKVYMKHFDADGIWEEALLGIAFTKITSVSFGTRYVEIFSKYV